MAERDEDLTFVGTTNLDRLAEIPDDRHRQAIERGLDLGLTAADSVRDRGRDGRRRRSGGSRRSTTATTSTWPSTSSRSSTSSMSVTSS